MLRVVTDARAQDELRVDLDELVGEGARRMLAAALEAEVDAYLAAHAAERDRRGRRLVVRNGQHPPARGDDRGGCDCGAGAAGGRSPHRSGHRPADPLSLSAPAALVPQEPKGAEVLPLLYLHRRSTGDFVPALEGFFGSAAGC